MTMMRRQKRKKSPFSATRMLLALANPKRRKSPKRRRSLQRNRARRKKRKKDIFAIDSGDDAVIGIGSQSATARKLGRSHVKDSVRLVDDSLNSLTSPAIRATPYASMRGYVDKNDSIFPDKPKWRESLLSNQSFEQQSMHDSNGFINASPFTSTPRTQFGGPRTVVGQTGYSTSSRSRATPLFPRFENATSITSPAASSSYRQRGGFYESAKHDPSVVAQRVLKSINQESKALSRDALSHHSQFAAPKAPIPTVAVNATSSQPLSKPISSSKTVQSSSRLPSSDSNFAIPDTPPVKHLTVKRVGSAVKPTFQFSPARSDRSPDESNLSIDPVRDEALENSFQFPSLE
mmetsp:Transcript_18013/g.31348  ORF Transcript_18013/g.31348 Transcript_18013/m.31348 type:complete len:348 (-) Transcript_18013:46-1089(-)